MHADRPSEQDPAEAAGEWLHDELMKAFGLETEAWATDRVARISSALDAKRPFGKPLTVEILWMQEMTAFAAPGRYVYISRELLQRTADDEPSALAIAHEIAHHDLGHLDLFAGRIGSLRHMPGGVATVAAIRLAQRAWNSPGNEAAADAYALDLCLGAGYDGAKCLQLFDILEAYAIDHGDLDIVFGTDEMLKDRPAGVRGMLARASASAFEHARGYLPIRTRKEVLLTRLGL